MRKSFKLVAVLIWIVPLFSSCATVLGGRVNPCQRHRPRNNEPTRQIRVVALVADIILWWPGLVIDFATGAIYRPCRGAGQQGTHIGSGDKAYIPDDDEKETDANEDAKKE